MRSPCSDLYRYSLELVLRCITGPDDLSIARKTTRTYGNVRAKWKGLCMRGLSRRNTVNRAISRPSRHREIAGSSSKCAHDRAHIFSHSIQPSNSHRFAIFDEISGMTCSETTRMRNNFSLLDSGVYLVFLTLRRHSVGLFCLVQIFFTVLDFQRIQENSGLLLNISAILPNT